MVSDGGSQVEPPVAGEGEDSAGCIRHQDVDALSQDEQRPPKKARVSEDQVDPPSEGDTEPQGVPELPVLDADDDSEAGPRPAMHESSRSPSIERPAPEDSQQTQRMDSPMPGSPVQGALSDFDEGTVVKAAGPWTKDQLPPPREHELEFIVQDPRSFRQGKSVLSEIKDLQGSFRFRLLVFPMGTESTGKPEQLAAFVEVVPPEGTDVRWAFEQVRYQLSVVNWKDYRRSATQMDTFTFQRDSADRGWHRGFLKASEMTFESGWLSESGGLCLRAACAARRAMVHMPSAGPVGATSRRSVGYVGLKNHGATCYMNCLLQTLFHIGRFRHIVYSIDLQDSSDQAAGSGDEMADSVNGGDERPALPLLTALQNLFYRLQTSEMVVSCRELMRSFGWDTADAFMQHDAQELNRLLCDRVEEQMKGTLMDGEIKRLFEGEMENYIECVNVDYRSTRHETFYDLQLNVRNDAGVDLTSLEESLRDFTSEEIMEDENAYDAGSHGKQRARKGIRFKRFPPVLHFQLKRFMFDVERLDMCKLNGRLEFPQVLDMEAFAPGSGTYLLHTVVVHSGGVSSGHYYAFVREREGEGGSHRWVKFDDEQVTHCSEHAAVEDNYGGEDPDLWNYFNIPSKELHDRSPPKVPRIHNAYMLSYVRADVATETLDSPGLDGEDTPYQRMSDRCLREARLAEERKRAKVESMTRIEVRLLFEKDLMALDGFWTHHDLPCSKKIHMSRDQSGEDLYTEVATTLTIPQTSFVLFLLQTRRTKQTRFKWIPPDEALRVHLPLHGAPHSSSCDPHFVVLCMASRDYDTETLECIARPNQPETVWNFSEWSDSICMLIVKYFCPKMQRIVCLGCYHTQSHETVDAMLNDEHWFQERLRPFVQRREVVQPPGKLLCVEEYCMKKPEDLLKRIAHNTIQEEGLVNGDVVVWQPEPECLRSNGSEVSCFVNIDGQRVPVFPKTTLEMMQAPRQCAVAGILLRTLGRLHARMSAPLKKHGATLLWLRAVLKTYLEPEPQPSQEEFADLSTEEREQLAMLHDRELHNLDLEQAELAEGKAATVSLIEEDERLQGSLIPYMAIEETSRTSGALPSLEAGFPADTVQDFLQKMVSQMHIFVRMCNVSETPWCPDGLPEAGDLTPNGEDGKEDGLVKVRELTVDMRWPVPIFMARVMEAFGIDPQVQNLWLFLAPPNLDSGPCFCTEDFNYDTLPPTMRGNFRDVNYNRRYRSCDKITLDLAPRTAYAPQGRFLFHVAAMDRQPEPELNRPVKVHFFNNHVVEVGSNIFYVQVRRDEEDGMDTDGDMHSQTGRPSLCTKDLMRLVREYLDQEPSLRSQLSPAADSEQSAKTLPLRLLDVPSSRIQLLPSEEGGGSGPSSCPGRGQNFLSAPLRVEPDWDIAGDASEVGPAAPERRPTQTVEVFHSEPGSTAAFGHPCFLHLRDGDDPAALLQAKLQVTDSEFAKWNIKLQLGSSRTAIESIWNQDGGLTSRSPQVKPIICVERRSPVQRTRSQIDARTNRAMKPLTIRGGELPKPSPPR